MSYADNVYIHKDETLSQIRVILCACYFITSADTSIENYIIHKIRYTYSKGNCFLYAVTPTYIRLSLQANQFTVHELKMCAKQ